LAPWEIFVVELNLSLICSVQEHADLERQLTLEILLSMNTPYLDSFYQALHEGYVLDIGDMEIKQDDSSCSLPIVPAIEYMNISRTVINLDIIFF